MRKSKKILIIAILAVVMLSLVIGGGITVWAMRREEIKDMNNSEIAEVLLASESSLGWVNGEKVNIDHETLNEVLSEMLEGCRLMPALEWR